MATERQLKARVVNARVEAFMRGQDKKRIETLFEKIGESGIELLSKAILVKDQESAQQLNEHKRRSEAEKRTLTERLAAAQELISKLQQQMDSSRLELESLRASDIERACEIEILRLELVEVSGKANFWKDEVRRRVYATLAHKRPFGRLLELVEKTRAEMKPKDFAAHSLADTVEKIDEKEKT